MSAAAVAKEIEKGGGVYARALIVGPRQEHWLAALERIDAAEVARAVGDVIAGAGGRYGVAARHLNVSEIFLSKYRATTSRLGKTIVYPYRPPTTKEQALPIVRMRCGGVGHGDRSGAWRVEDLLADPISQGAAVEAIAEVVNGCENITEVAAALGVTRMTLRKWRILFPRVGIIVSTKRGGRRPKAVVKLGSGDRRRLSLEEAIDLMRPHLPGTPREVHAGILEAAESRRGPHGVVPSVRQLGLLYVGKPDARGLMVIRSAERRGDEVVKIWALVDSKTGRRFDKGKNDERRSNGRPRGAKDKGPRKKR